MTTPRNPAGPPPHEPGQQGEPHPGPYGQHPYGHNPYGQDPYAQDPYGRPSPYDPNPYDPNPHGYDPYGPPSGVAPYGAPAHPGPPPYQFPPSGPGPQGQPDSEPGRFTWWDFGATLFYIGTFFVGLIGVLVFIPQVNAMLTSGDTDDLARADFLLNAVGYSVMALICLVLSGPALWRSIKTFAHLWWLKLLLIPVGWLSILLINAVLVMLLTDSPETSANQQAIEQMLGAVPLLGALIVLGLLGPYVEEFFFRHLLVGKLSRHLNIWICGAISVMVFPLIHFIPALVGLTDDLSLLTFIPYVTMGTAFTLVYILAGRSLFYSWLLHAANNSMAVLLQYFVVPLLPELDDLDGLSGLSGMILPMLVSLGGA